MSGVLPRSLSGLRVLALAAMALSGCGHDAPGPGGLRGASALPPDLAGASAPRIRLSDARGGTFDTATLHGRPYVVTFLYTRCPDVCPLIGAELQQALSRLGPRAKKAAVVALSVDPAHDTPTAVGSWLERHREPANFHYLIGSQRALAPYWRAYFASPQVPGDPSSSHTAAIWLIDARGRRVALMSAGVPISVADLVHNLAYLIAHS